MGDKEETMILRTTNSLRLPPGARRLSAEEAFVFQKSFIKKWHSESEVFFLKYGSLIASAVTMISSGIVTAYFRRTVSLNYQGVLAIAVPGVLIPGYVSAQITENTLLKDTALSEKCPLCTQLKYSVLHFAGCIISPLVFLCTGSCLYASAKKTFPFVNTNSHFPPNAHKDFHVFLKGAHTIFKHSIYKIYPTVGLLHIGLLFTLPYMMDREFNAISSSLRKTENPLLAS